MKSFLFIYLTYDILQRCKAMDMSHLSAHKQYDKQPEQPHQEGAQGHALPSGNDDQEEPIWQRDDRGWSRTESNRSSGNISLSLSDSLFIWAKKKKVIAHVTWNGDLTGLNFVQWGADRRQTDQDDGIPSFDWNHGKNGRIGYRRKVRGQHGGYFVFLVHIGV